MDPTSSKHRAWRITVRARSKGLDFRFRASHVPPGWGGGRERISLLLRLRRLFYLKLDSENREPGPKLLRFLAKIFRRRRNGFLGNKVAVDPDKKSETWSHKMGWKHFKCGHRRCQGTVAAMMGSLSLLSHSSSKKDHQEITVHSFAIICYLLSLLKMRRTHFPLLLVSSVVSVIGFSVSYLSYAELVTKAVQRAWNIMIFLGCSFSLPQGLFILSKTSLHIGTRVRIWMMWSIILAFLLFSSCEWTGEISFDGMKILIDGALVWIPELLLNCQAFSHIWQLYTAKDLDALGAYLSLAYILGRRLAKFWCLRDGWTVSYMKNASGKFRYQGNELLELLRNEIMKIHRVYG